VVAFQKMKHQRIINSVLDTDWYKLTMRRVVATKYPNAIAIYEFINRGNHKFPKDFHYALQDQIESIGILSLTESEKSWAIANQTSLIVNGSIKYDTSQVIIDQDGSNLGIKIIGRWSESILWETTLMPTISELFYKMTGQTVSPGFMQRMDQKSVEWIDNECYWSDFGTRRRFSYSVQDEVNRIYRHYQPFYQGTSNPHFAMKYNLPVLGTYAHEAPMAMQRLAQPGQFHEMEWLNNMAQLYGAENVLILGDTLGLDVILRYGVDLARFGGFRIDSGDPLEAAKKVVVFYKDKNVDMSTKTVLFSDGLNTNTVLMLRAAMAKLAPELIVRFGIGTHLTNDVGLKPMNMVIKMTHIAKDSTSPFESVVKISDSPGKESGEPKDIARLREAYNLG
jgi:nicotinate phosphoribosyltransferase